MVLFVLFGRSFGPDATLRTCPVALCQEVPMRARFAVGLVVAASLLMTPGASASSPVSLPESMAAVGDSITAATDVGWCCVNPNGGNPQYSWSTGSNVRVNSHAQRIAELRGRTPIFATDL